MSYDNPYRKDSYRFPSIDFGTGSDIAKTIEVPGGRRGRVTNVRIEDVTEDFAGSTSDAGVQVGDGTDADKYYDTGLVLDETVDVADLAYLDLDDDGSKVDIEADRSTITVTFVSAVGTPTGIASVVVDVEWF
jgi:hypothetical protein